MQIQTVFKAGNSNVVAIPKDIADELGMKAGQKVLVEKDEAGEALVIKKATKVNTKAKKSGVSADFKKWLSDVLVEDAGILDELAKR
jgi:AbrB family looped-hinge helix DNA binding protein